MSTSNTMDLSFVLCKEDSQEIAPEQYENGPKVLQPSIRTMIFHSSHNHLSLCIKRPLIYNSSSALKKQDIIINGSRQIPSKCSAIQSAFVKSNLLKDPFTPTPSSSTRISIRNTNCNRNKAKNARLNRRGEACGVPFCVNKTVSKGKCISHGGGKRCIVSGCPKGAKLKGRCQLHGGFKTCKFPHCNNNGKTRGLCWIHGGGTKICSQNDCMKYALKGGFCWAHGGGKRCAIEGCRKSPHLGNCCKSHKMHSRLQ